MRIHAEAVHWELVLVEALNEFVKVQLVWLKDPIAQVVIKRQRSVIRIPIEHMCTRTNVCAEDNAPCQHDRFLCSWTHSVATVRLA